MKLLSSSYFIFLQKFLPKGFTVPHRDCTECNTFTAGKIKSDLKFKEAFFPKNQLRGKKLQLYILLKTCVCMCLLLQLKKTFLRQSALETRTVRMCSCSLCQGKPPFARYELTDSFPGTEWTSWITECPTLKCMLRLWRCQDHKISNADGSYERQDVQAVRTQAIFLNFLKN